MKLQLGAMVLGLVAALARPAAAEPTTIDHVTIVNVADGTRTQDRSITFDGDRITAIGPYSLRGPGRRVDGTGLFVLPGLWDMHVHSHRERRWTYHYPLFRAFGITGVREAGTHLGSALALREHARADALAPRVIWGTPIVDGAPQVNSFGLSAEDEASARHLVRELHRQGFDFLKVYDRLTPDAYRGLTSEARRLGMPIEGHVPLALSPDVAITSGQRLIDHLTMVAEGCSPRTLAIVNRQNSQDPRASESLSLLETDELKLRWRSSMPPPASRCSIGLRPVASGKCRPSFNSRASPAHPLQPLGRRAATTSARVCRRIGRRPRRKLIRPRWQTGGEC